MATKVGKLNPVVFISEVRSELQKVQWPTRDEAIRLTIIVVAISVVVGIFIGALDVLFISITDMFLR